MLHFTKDIRPWQIMPA